MSDEENVRNDGEREEEYDVHMIPLSDINTENTTFQYRLVTSTKDLKQSIEEHDQQMPVILRGQPPYQIVCGFRRIMCLVELGRPTVKATVHEEMNAAAARFLAFAENYQRKNFGPLDVGNAVAKLRVAGKTHDQIGDLFSLKESQVRNYAKMSKFPKDLEEAVSEGKVTATHALVLFDAANKISGFSYPEWVKQIQEKSLSVADLKKALAREVRKSKSKRKRIFEKKGDGFRLYSVTYDPAKTSAADKKKLISNLKKALAVLEVE